MRGGKTIRFSKLQKISIKYIKIPSANLPLEGVKGGFVKDTVGPKSVFLQIGCVHPFVSLAGGYTPKKDLKFSKSPRSAFT